MLLPIWFHCKKKCLAFLVRKLKQFFLTNDQKNLISLLVLRCFCILSFNMRCTTKALPFQLRLVEGMHWFYKTQLFFSCVRQIYSKVEDRFLTPFKNFRSVLKFVWVFYSEIFGRKLLGKSILTWVSWQQPHRQNEKSLSFKNQNLSGDSLR